MRKKDYRNVLELMGPESQEYLILKHIIEHGKITDREAERKPIYSRRLSARIYDIRHKYNVPIETEMVYEKKRKKIIPHAEYKIG